MENRLYGSNSIFQGVANPLFVELEENYGQTYDHVVYEGIERKARYSSETVYGFANPMYAGDVQTMKIGFNHNDDEYGSTTIDEQGNGRAMNDLYLQTNEDEGEYDIISPIRAVQDVYLEAGNQIYDQASPDVLTHVHDDTGYLDVDARVEDPNTAHEQSIGSSAGPNNQSKEHINASENDMEVIAALGDHEGNPMQNGKFPNRAVEEVQGEFTSPEEDPFEQADSNYDMANWDTYSYEEVEPE